MISSHHHIAWFEQLHSSVSTFDYYFLSFSVSDKKEDISNDNQKNYPMWISIVPEGLGKPNVPALRVLAK